MKTAFIAALTLSTSIIPQTAYADVNMLEASFQKTFVDADIEGLKIARRYQSRSNFSGVFGFGWCSTFDTKLVFGKTLRLNECGELRAPTNVRYVKGEYIQTTSSGLQRTFSSETGELKTLRAPGGREIAIERSRLPRDAALGEGLIERPGNATLTLIFDSLGENIVALVLPLVREASHQDRLLRFSYSTDRNLLSAQNAWSNTYTFGYDRVHNLTSIEYPDSTSEQLEYDSDKDQLIRFEGRRHCIETYEHVVSRSSQGIHQISEAHLACPEESKPRIARFDFWFIQKNGKWSLKNMKRGVQ